MGRRKFRFSEMMPNAWFYRLKASMIRPQKNNSSLPTTAPLPINMGRASYYIPSGERDKLLPWSPTRLPRGSKDASRLLLDSPRKSSRKPTRVKGSRASPPTKPYGVCPVYDAEWKTESESLSEYCPPIIHGRQPEDEHLSLPCTDKAVISELLNNRGTDTDTPSNSGVVDSEVPLEVVEVDLPPILTKPINQEPSLASPQGEHRRISRIRRPQGPKRRVLVTTPRITDKPTAPEPREQHRRPRRSGRGGATAGSVSNEGRVMAGSVAVVRASKNPKRDFQESMMEMIAANGIRGLNELEELLACYLSLNSAEYHDVIVKVFEQVWFDFTHGSGARNR